MLAIQALVTCLLVLIITPTNAFEATAEADIRPLDTFTVVNPRRKAEFDDELSALLDDNPAQASRVEAKFLWVRTPMIVSHSWSPMIALPRDIWPEFLAKLDVELIEGSFPKPDSDGVVLHEDVVRGRGMKLGDEFGRAVNVRHTTPGKFTLVGVFGGPSRVGLTDLAYASKPATVLYRRPPVQVVYAKTGRKDESDQYLRDARQENGHEAFTVIDARYARQRVAEVFQNLPLLIGFITGSVALVVALVISLLNVIAFQVRVDEFGLYLAIGHARWRLVRKLAIETSLVAVLAWLLGLGLGLLGVYLYKHLWLAPKGIAIYVIDARPLLFSLSVPVLSTLTGAIALGRRLHSMDPVAVIQRRGT